MKKPLNIHLLMTFSLVILLLAAVSSPRDTISIGVLNFKTSQNLSKTVGAEISDSIRFHLKHIETFNVMDIAEMNSMLSKQGFLRPSGCRSIECHSTSFDSQGTLKFLEQCGITDNDAALEIGNMIGVDKIVFGLVNKLKDRYAIIVKIIDIRTAEVEITDQISYKYTIQNLDECIDELTARIAEKITLKKESLEKFNRRGDLKDSQIGEKRQRINLRDIGDAKDMNELRQAIRNKMTVKDLKTDSMDSNNYSEDIGEITTISDSMVFVPAGPFIIGSNDFEGEGPAHEIYLDAFYIDKYEVTNSEYKKFLDATGYRPPPTWEKSGFNHPDQPVIGINWEAANEYATWAGKRLPTEAEWEKAARGLDGRHYPWGNVWSAGKCRAGGIGTLATPAPVGSYPEGISPYGCHDMAGNVWEWCADWFSLDYYSQSENKNPKGPHEGSFHVLRGGGWESSSNDVRTTVRRGGCPDGGYGCAGFRCVKDSAQEKK